MSSDRAPAERPAGEPNTSDGAASDASDDHPGLSEITTTPGRRRTSDVEMLVIEAELVADGHEPDNPAIPVDEETGETLRDRLASHEDDLVPAWTRPWEVKADE